MTADILWDMLCDIAPEWECEDNQMPPDLFTKMMLAYEIEEQTGIKLPEKFLWCRSLDDVCELCNKLMNNKKSQ